MTWRYEKTICWKAHYFIWNCSHLHDFGLFLLSFWKCNGINLYREWNTIIFKTLFLCALIYSIGIIQQMKVRRLIRWECVLQNLQNTAARQCSEVLTAISVSRKLRWAVPSRVCFISEDDKERARVQGLSSEHHHSRAPPSPLPPWYIGPSTLSFVIHFFGCYHFIQDWREWFILPDHVGCYQGRHD